MKLLARIGTKRLVIGLVVFAVLVLAGAYAAWSIASWRALEERTASAKQASEDVLAKLRTEVLTVETFDGLHRMMTDASPGDTCELSALVAWQKVVPGRQAVLDGCDQAQALVKRRDAALQQVRQYVAGEAELVASLKTATDKLAATEPTNYEAMLQVWRQAKADSAKEEGDTGKVKAAVTEKIDAIIAALDELNKANAAKDRKAFDVAQEKVKQAYAALATVQETATAAYAEKIDALLEAY